MNFETGKIAYHCATEELANEFLFAVGKQGYGWASERKGYFPENYYSKYKEKTCYNLREDDLKKRVMFGYASFFKIDGYKIVEFTGGNV